MKTDLNRGVIRAKASITEEGMCLKQAFMQPPAREEFGFLSLLVSLFLLISALSDTKNILHFKTMPT